MDSRTIREFWVKRCPQRVTFPHEDRLIFDRGEHFDRVADACDLWCTDEDRVYVIFRDGGLQVRFEAFELTTVGVALHRNIEPTERPLIGSTILDLGRQQDQTGAGAEDRHACRDPDREWLVEPRRLEQHRHRGRLAPRHDQRVHGF